MSHQVNTPLGDHTLSFETGKMAKQANGAVYARFGDTVVLATACSGDPRPGINFFPLTVDYREYQSSVGRIPGGFFKREGRPSEKEIITCRLTDRQIRPLFPDGYQDSFTLFERCASTHIAELFSYRLFSNVIDMGL